MAVLEAAMEWPDIIVIVLYFVIVLGVGLWVSQFIHHLNVDYF